MRLTLLVFVPGLLASQAGALSLGPRTILRGLLARQTDPLASVPPETCESTDCLCTVTTGRLLEDCIECGVDILPTPETIAAGQGILDGTGTSVPSLTISPRLTTSAGAPTDSLDPVSLTTNTSGSPTISAGTFPLTSISRIVQTTVTTMPEPEEPESSAGATSDPPNNGARGLAGGVATLVVGLITGAAIGLV
ncbi:hypothetical protein D9615_008604 [Tricholomella constricta]|uniref:Uncharacterized protein n=1 Tax=Tricholomella constricta TaxID=117010 RepID=A0A8H5H3V6_9AGAR|nr:hypothetical protein D9615_008604 [Tricholomella constricta]